MTLYVKGKMQGSPPQVVQPATVCAKQVPAGGCNWAQPRYYIV